MQKKEWNLKTFTPNYNHIVEAACNRPAERLPLYEHAFDAGIVERIMDTEIAPLLEGDPADKTEGYRRICRFAIQHGYDCIPFEGYAVSVVQQGEGLKGHTSPLFGSMAELDAWPWQAKPDEYKALYRDHFEALRAALPPGMKAVGGVGTGLFETVQDCVPFEELAFLRVDEPDLYDALWTRVGQLQQALWEWVLAEYSDCFAVFRFGDDLGFRTSTLLNPSEIRRSILPHYKKIVDRVHAVGKPFLLHCCGCIYDVMDDLIDAVGIDAKHSNEDAIDRFEVWVTRYGDRIGNFGGVDMNVLTLSTPDEVKAYVTRLLGEVAGHGAIAIGSGNQIASYTEPANFIAMTEAVREWRGDR